LFVEKPLIANENVGYLILPPLTNAFTSRGPTVIYELDNIIYLF